jgi:hypothetical protein
MQSPLAEALCLNLKRAMPIDDGQHRSSIAWTGGVTTGTLVWGNGFLVMPRGVLLAKLLGGRELDRG